MTITWYGQSCIRIDAREATLAIDPFSKDIGLAPPRFSASIVLLTHAHPDHAHAAAIGGNPLAIGGPGEYEVRGIAIRGIPTFHDARAGAERGPNTAYRIEADGIALAHLGDYGESGLREEAGEALGEVDVLFVPVGGATTINGEAAARIVRAIEPGLAIPIHYRLPGLTMKLEGPERFLSALGGSALRQDRLVIRKKDLAGEGTRAVVLAPYRARSGAGLAAHRAAGASRSV